MLKRGLQLRPVVYRCTPIARNDT